MIQSHKLFHFIGFAWTGKSTLINYLSPKYQINQIQSDIVRKQLFGSPLYTDEENQATFEYLQKILRNQLWTWKSILFEWSGTRLASRVMIEHLAEEYNYEYIQVYCKTPDDKQVKNRIEQRLTKSDRDHNWNRENALTLRTLRDEPIDPTFVIENNWEIDQRYKIWDTLLQGFLY